MYGVQWRKFSEVDQITELINNIKTNPQSRRHLLSAWNVEEIDKGDYHLVIHFHNSMSQMIKD